MEKSKLEEYLGQLKFIDNQLNDDGNPDELMKEVNTIVKELSSDVNPEELLIPELKFVNMSNNPDPSFACEGDSGFDLRAFIEKDINIPAGEVRIIPTGLYFEVNKGLEIQIRSRSGLAANSNMMVLNSPGTIDSFYRGQALIILANFDEMSHTIRNGDRIAQGVVCPVYGEGRLKMSKVQKLSETMRGAGGIGHTGIK